MLASVRGAGSHSSSTTASTIVNVFPSVTAGLDPTVTEGETVVVIGEWTYTGLTGKVRQPSVSVVDVRDGQIWRDLEYVGLAI